MIEIHIQHVLQLFAINFFQTLGQTTPLRFYYVRSIVGAGE